ncbi:MAG: helix-turn-helix domain-containing protein, partial [Eubacteriales bacterium]|nr:helix-turn-helix domain-containing protein [Eubacteriales bacterium]
DRIRFLNDKIASFTSGTAESRLARYIENLREEDGCVILPTGLRQLADSLDISRASLYRAFDTLESLGCIKRDGRKIAILSAELLKDVK